MREALLLARVSQLTIIDRLSQAVMGSHHISTGLHSLEDCQIIIFSLEMFSEFGTYYQLMKLDLPRCLFSVIVW